MPNTLSTRLRQARRFANLTQIQLTERINASFDAGVTQPAIQRIESGKVKSTRYIAQIASVCGVNALWLATGQGKMSND